MRTTIFAGGLAIGVLAIGLFAWDANATSCTLVAGGTCSILDSGDTATTADGTVFLGDPNPTVPSTGSGVFMPFLTTQTPTSGNGVEKGFNSDATGVHSPADQTKPRGGPNVATRSVLFSELGTVACSTSTTGQCYELQLDANQTSGATTLQNQITIENLKIFIGPNLANITTVSGLTPDWTMDSATNGNVTLILQASICDTPGQCGSGHGDLDVFIPSNFLTGSGTDNFVLYTNFSGGNDGFEEWRFLAGAPTVPEPTSLLLLGSGLIGLGLWQWKRRKDVQV